MKNKISVLLIAFMLFSTTLMQSVSYANGTGVTDSFEDFFTAGSTLSGWYADSALSTPLSGDYDINATSGGITKTGEVNMYRSIGTAMDNTKTTSE